MDNLPDFLKPHSRPAPSGGDPLAMPGRGHGGGPNWIIIILLSIAMLALCGLGSYGVVGWFKPAASATPTATRTPESTAADPAVSIVGPSATAAPQAAAGGFQVVTNAAPTLITGRGLLTELASSATAGPIIVTSTRCIANHFLTQLACDDLYITQTIAAGGLANVSGVSPNETVVYIYPTPSPTPWIITATPSPTDHTVIVTVIVERIITATPAPSQTPWFFITQPAAVTVVWTQEVTRLATQLVTVIITATPPAATATPAPSDTAAPSATAAPSDSPTPSATSGP